MADSADPRRISSMKLLIIAFAGLAACSSWHWEKRGALDGEYVRDETFCKQQVYSGTDGIVTNASVRGMHSCMQARGWRKVEN